MAEEKIVPVLNVPNALTVLRLVFVPLFGWMLLSHPDDPTWRWWTTAVFVVAVLTDLADGKIARKYNLITNFGKLWDPIADKAITGMAFIGLSILGQLWWWVTIVILVREWGITIMRFLIVKYGVMAADKLGKMKTLCQTISLGFLLAPLMLYLPAGSWSMSPIYLPDGSWTWWQWLLVVVHWAALVVMAAALILTVVSGVNYCVEAWKLRKAWLAAHTASGDADTAALAAALPANITMSEKTGDDESR